MFSQGWFNTMTGEGIVGKSFQHRAIAMTVFENTPGTTSTDDLYGWMFDRGWARISRDGIRCSTKARLKTLKEFVADSGVKPRQKFVLDFGGTDWVSISVAEFLDADSWSALLAMAKSIQNPLSDIGEFSNPPVDGVFFHGFPRTSVMVQRLKDRSFGEAWHGTSCGVASSYVPHMDRVYFTVKTAKLFPVFYQRSNAKVDWYTLKETIGEMFGVSVAKAQVGPWMYRRENEWHSPKKIQLKDINVLYVTYSRRNTDKELGELFHICDRRGYECISWADRP